MSHVTVRKCAGGGDRQPASGKWRSLEGFVEEEVMELKMASKCKEGVPGRQAVCAKAQESRAAEDIC